MSELLQSIVTVSLVFVFGALPLLILIFILSLVL